MLVTEQKSSGLFWNPQRLHYQERDHQVVLFHAIIFPLPPRASKFPFLQIHRICSLVLYLTLHGGKIRKDI